MDFKHANLVLLRMQLNTDQQTVPPNVCIGLDHDHGTTIPISQGSSSNYPPRSLMHYNINVPLEQSTITEVIDRTGAPPSYEEVIDPNAPPPSYESLFGRVREAHKTRKGIFDFLRNILCLIFGSIGYSIIWGITVVIPICMMVIGGIFIYDCPQGEYIPVYLLVGGGLGVLKQMLLLFSRIRQCRQEERIRQTSTETLIDCFMLGWLIIGSMWVYKEYKPNFDPSISKLYCNKTLYLFAFWVITSTYILLAITIFCICSISLASVIFQ
ncbi:uncharacterized protein LOC106650004 [Trichogramma pretiosum]|uniref:uncharacterized protein LOC106650004 n=1 Tax=Trichogramma pretiosum TaxID=7493 RepID=UPI0006C9B6A8|nr:uncharacterized protein LOC106650004 [Trichogramma pretiosum]XP_014223255.1 uncharacterized protein LOC106650004 [Trichogramma pretiosum]